MAASELFLKISLWVGFFILNYSSEGNIFKWHSRQLILIMQPESFRSVRSSDRLTSSQRGRAKSAKSDISVRVRSLVIEAVWHLAFKVTTVV